MNILEKQLKKIESLFEEGKPLAKWYPLYEALDTFLMTPGKIAPKAPYVRDAVDIKRVMIFVVVALIPATLAKTTLGKKRAGDSVNMEADILGKHILHYLRGQSKSSIDMQFLAQHGYVQR